ncbi:MAG TPA: hypothetical protein VIH59_01290 [Candidatus Tectomicrobia bacterium]
MGVRSAQSFDRPEPFRRRIRHNPPGTSLQWTRVEAYAQVIESTLAGVLRCREQKNFRICMVEWAGVQCHVGWRM